MAEREESDTDTNTNTDTDTDTDSDYDYFALLKEMDACVIFPRGSDFGSVCSCHDCSEKINRLKEFDEELQHRRKLIREEAVLLDNQCENCLSLSGSSQMTVVMLDLLHKSLKIVSKSGLSSTLEKGRLEEEMKYIDNMIADMVFDDLIDKPLDEKASDDEEGTDIRLAAWIDAVIYYYGRTKFKDQTHGILKEIQRIEKEHDQEKKSAEAQKKAMDPKISMQHIEKQIELIRQLPMKELYNEFQKLVLEISPYRERAELVETAHLDIRDTFGVMIKMRFEFWVRYQSAIKDKDMDHNLSGLKDTLESLCNQADLFNDRWDKVYATYFTTYQRPDASKRPRIV